MLVLNAVWVTEHIRWKL